VRAEQGQGTQRVVKLNNNRRLLLTVLGALGRPASVVEVLAFLVAAGHKRVGRNKWDYHMVQVDLSLLVGNRYVSMSDDQPPKYSLKRREW